MLRSVLAWAGASFLAALLPAGLFAILAFDGRIAPGRATGTAFALAFAIALGHVLLLGVPVAAWLRRRGRFTPRRMLLAGGIAGMVPCALLLLWQTQAQAAAIAGLFNPAIAAIVLSAGGFGLLASGVLWGVLRLVLGPARV